MPRVLVLVGLVTLLVAVPATHGILAAKATKVSLCHVNGSNSPGIRSTTLVGAKDYTDLDPKDGHDYEKDDIEFDSTVTHTYHLGRVIEVAEDAVEAHLQHGDSTTFADLSDSMADQITSLEDGDGTTSVSGSFEEPGVYRVDYWQKSTVDSTNGVIGNANCYWLTYETVNN